MAAKTYLVDRAGQLGWSKNARPGLVFQGEGWQSQGEVSDLIRCAYQTS